jgi:tetratricopeptide (TPR) repeat protein
VADWPDGTVAARYEFLHALYQEVTYARVPAGRQARLHQRIGERAEQGYGARAAEIAAELAVHFERGRDYHRAARYLQLAGENAARRSAYQEAISQLTKGLELLKTLPDTPERVRQEIALQIALGHALLASKGYAAPEVEKTYTRALELCRQVGETLQLIFVLGRLVPFYQNRGEFQTARELAEQMMQLAQRAQDPHLFALAHARLGSTLYYLGELTSARTLLEQGSALYDPHQHPYLIVDTANPKLDCLAIVSRSLLLLGYPEQGLKRSQEAVAVARGLSYPFGLAIALGGRLPCSIFIAEMGREPGSGPRR